MLALPGIPALGLTGCMNSSGRIVDAWMQHPTKDFLAHPMFESLHRWAHGGLATVEVPIEATIAAMDEAGVRVGLICAWWGPQGPLVGNTHHSGG